MAEVYFTVGSSVALPKNGLEGLITNLRQMGYQVLGPKVKDNAIIYGPLGGMDELPRGYISVQDAARYRLVQTGHERYFDITPGASSWKQFLFPPLSQMAAFRRTAEGRWQLEPDAGDILSYAFVGVRPCDLAAIQVQDRVFLREDWSTPLYRLRRQGAFILAVNCLHPSGTCFCASMGSGPKAGSGFDLCLTELDDVFVIEIGSETGRLALDHLQVHPASAFWLRAVQNGLDDAAQKMGRFLEHPDQLPDLLLNNLEAEHWDDVARRCMSCANCTQVCPTCFCWDVRDTMILSGQSAWRERVWDSCFNPDYAYVVGGNTRPNTRSRYRQWLTHKFGSWQAQFGVSGCVGCGRCITWCPAGIDVTAEVAAIREEVRS
jgi:sulfhydrogenase subunit beta (sulfur reductase)